MRKYFLRMAAVWPMENTSFSVNLKTKEDFRFDVEFTCIDGITFMNGESWKEFCRVYQFKVGMEIIIKAGNSEVPTEVINANDPITHPCKFPN